LVLPKAARAVRIASGPYVLSQEPDARWPGCDGENATDVTGPSWPESTSSSLPVCRDHRKISYESSEPATTSSLETSSASDTSDKGLGVVNVLTVAPAASEAMVHAVA